ncbi:MAG: DUF1614 domain-containing protein [Thermoguttaceae bacterium]
MNPQGYHHPLGGWFLLGLAFLVAAIVGLIEFGVLSYAYEKMGVKRRYVFLLLFLSLLGCYVNIPLGRAVAINVGGAVIPLILSLYLLVKNALYSRAAAGVAIVAAVVFFVARPVGGVGVQVPIFLPPLMAAAVALLLSRDHAAPLAYISGTLGTLIGADVLNLGNLAGVRVASIGGAGTFDGVFLTGIIAVLLA